MVQNAKMKNIGKMLLSWAAVIVLVVAIVIFTIVKGTAFFSVANLLNILRAMSVVTIFALAATVSMAPDGFDMSAGTLGTFSAYVFCSIISVVWTSTLACGCGNNFVYNVFLFINNVSDSCLQDSGYAGNMCASVCTCGVGISVHRWKCRFGRSWRTEMGSKSSGRRYKSTAWGMD